MWSRLLARNASINSIIETGASKSANVAIMLSRSIEGLCVVQFVIVRACSVSTIYQIFIIGCQIRKQVADSVNRPSKKPAFCS